MKTFRRTQAEQAPQRDQQLLAVMFPSDQACSLTMVRNDGDRLEVVSTLRWNRSEGAPAAADCGTTGRTVTVLAGADVIVRAVQLPSADESRLESALQLNASTFVLGRTPSWRVASALLPRERGDRIRTGLVVEWPEESAAPEPDTTVERTSGASTCAPAIAGLTALAAVCDDPTVWVDAREGVLSVCVPTSAGLLARTVRAGAAGEPMGAADVARTVAEACVHAGVAAAEIPDVVARSGEAASTVLAGGFGCSARDMERLAAEVRLPAGAGDAEWWRTHGLEVGIAIAAFGPALPLTQLHATEPGVRTERLGAWLNRLAEPRTGRKLMIAGLAAIVLAPLVIEGARRLVLHWKMPDLPAYLRAEELDRKKQAMYRVLSRQGASMTKTLSDLACCAPDGVEIEFINIAGSAKGQAVTVRGKARPAANLQAPEVMLEMDKGLRESGAFDQILRSVEMPDSRGYQEFTLNATAIRPTYTVAFPESEDFAKVTMRERRYGPPPEDVDLGASGADAGTADSGKGAGGKTTAKPASKPTDAKPATKSTDAKPADAAPATKPEAAPAKTPTKKPSVVTAGSKETTNPDEESGSGSGASKGAGRESRGSAGRNLSRRNAPGGSAEADPPPPPLSENEINAMTKEEARDALMKVSKARQRADLDDATQARLKNEFNQLLERCKRP